MTDKDTLRAMTRILRDLLMDETIDLKTNTKREDVPGWDSLMYINFIAAVEAEFGVKFAVGDIESFANVGEIANKAVELSRSAS